MDEDRNGIIGDDQITSTDFDYDVYSGKSAQEYLRQENERKRREREDAAKTDGMRKREEYEKRFAGMTPDELFASPAKKKKPEEDFSDFFDADEIERQQEKVRQFEQEVHSTPKVESMMPGEDAPSSQAHDEKYYEGIETVNAMLARQRIRNEKSRERMDRLGGTGRRGYRYHRRYGLFDYMIDYLFTDTTLPSGVSAVLNYIFSAMIGVLLFLPFRRLKMPQTYVLVFAGVSALLFRLIQCVSKEEMSFTETIKASIFEIIACAILTAIGIGMA